MQSKMAKKDQRLATTNHDIEPWMKVLMLEVDQILKSGIKEEWGEVTTSVRKDLTCFIDYITNGEDNGIN